MKKSTKDNLKITVSALLAIPVVLGFIGLLAWAGLDWKLWFPFAAWTVFVFGFLIKMFWNDLKKLRCFTVFVLLVLVYAAAWYSVLMSGIRLPDVTYMFLSPLEGGAGAFILTVLGHGRGNGLGRRQRRIKSPPEL